MAISWNGEDASTPPGSSYGCAKVSTTDRDLDVLYDALERAGCRVIRAGKASGTSVQGRAELRILLDFIRPGDELVVTRVDRRCCTKRLEVGSLLSQSDVSQRVALRGC